MLHTKKGAQIEDAALKEKARKWRSRAFQNGSREKIASFSEWLANRKRCAQRNGAQMEIVSFSE